MALPAYIKYPQECSPEKGEMNINNLESDID